MLIQFKKDLSFAPEILLNFDVQFYDGIAVAGVDPKVDEMKRVL